MALPDLILAATTAGAKGHLAVVLVCPSLMASCVERLCGSSLFIWEPSSEKRSFYADSSPLFKLITTFLNILDRCSLSDIRRADVSSAAVRRLSLFSMVFPEAQKVSTRMMCHLSVICTFLCIIFGGQQVLSFLLATCLELEFPGPGASVCEF